MPRYYPADAPSRVTLARDAYEDWAETVCAACRCPLGDHPTEDDPDRPCPHSCSGVAPRRVIPDPYPHDDPWAA